MTNIEKFGFWLLVRGKEYFLPYKEYPWFRRATIEEILDVRLFHGRHLHWAMLDVDLSVESLEHPEDFPLVDRVQVRPSRRRR